MTGLLRMFLRLSGDLRALMRGRGGQRLLKRGARKAMRGGMRNQSRQSGQRRD